MKKPEVISIQGDGYGFQIQPNGNLTFDGGDSIAVRPNEAKKIMESRKKWEVYKEAQLAEQLEIDKLRQERDALSLKAQEVQKKINDFAFPRSRKLAGTFEVYLRSELAVYHRADSVRVGCNTFPWNMAERVFKLITERSNRKKK